MPTDQEKLAIAEERVKVSEEIFMADLPRTIYLQDVVAKCVEGPCWKVYCRKSNQLLCNGLGAADQVIVARQKLAAEKEAARTPEERRLIAELERLKKVLDDIATYGGYSRTGSCCADIARKALEQGA